MKLDFKLSDFDENYAELFHTFKGIEFRILIAETINTEMISQNCHAIFRTPKGKYKHDFWVSPEFISDLTESVFLDEVCKIVYDAFESKFGWT